MAWFRKPKYSTVKAAPGQAAPADSPITKCEGCGATHVSMVFDELLRVCDRCGFHHRITARLRLPSLADADSFRELDRGMRSTNVLGFPGYDEKIRKGEAATGMADAVLTGEAKIDGHPVVLAITDFVFIG